MSNIESVALDTVFSPKNYPYTSEIQHKFEDLTQEIDALLLKLKQEKHESSLDHFELTTECNPSFSTAS